MKAITCRKYGPPDVLQLEDIPKPVPKDDEVLVKVRAASINSYDWRLMVADPFLVRLFFGFFKPKYPVPGADLAGTVEGVGRMSHSLKLVTRCSGIYQSAATALSPSTLRPTKNSLPLNPPTWISMRRQPHPLQE